MPTNDGGMESIKAGDDVLIFDVDGRAHEAKAVSGVESDGHWFPIVWVNRPLVNGETDLVAWPADAVRPLSTNATLRG